MKTFNELITEFAFYDKYKAKKRFHKKVSDVEEKYPGVNYFFKAASEWANEIKPENDVKLYKLLSKLKRKRTIEDLNDHDLRMVYKFLINRGVNDYEDMELMFIGAIED